MSARPGGGNDSAVVHDRLVADLQNYSVAESGCHLWGGYRDRNGYGKVYDPQAKRTEWVHRASYVESVGPIPVGHEIDHLCCTVECINPAHLEAVTKVEHAARTFRRLGKDKHHRIASELRSTGLTYAEIAQTLELLNKDSAYQMVQCAIRKGLVGADEIPRRRHLSDAEKADVRDLYALGVTQPVLAETYGVDNSNISRVLSGKTLRKDR